jgi:Conserved hypothetical protein (DUF2461)
MIDDFRGWPATGPALLARIAAENTREFWAECREQHGTDVRAPMQALAAALAPEFGPVRVFRAHANRRFRPDAPPLRTDTGGVAATAGGCVRAVVLSPVALSVSAGHWAFDGGQLRRFRAAVDSGDEITGVLAGLEGWSLAESRVLTGRPLGYPPDHPRIVLLRRRGLQATLSWELGPWLQTDEPLRRVREAWRAAALLTAWLDERVGPADPVPPRPRPVSAPEDEQAAGA